MFQYMYEMNELEEQFKRYDLDPNKDVVFIKELIGIRKIRQAEVSVRRYGI